MLTDSEIYTYCDNRIGSDTYVGMAGRYMCYVLAFMFIPNQESINQFKNLDDEIMTKFPFDYIRQGYNLVVYMAEDPADYTDTLTYTTPTNTGSIAVSIFDLSEVASSTSAIGTMRTYMSSIMWVLWGISIFGIVWTII